MVAYLIGSFCVPSFADGNVTVSAKAPPLARMFFGLRSV